MEISNTTFTGFWANPDKARLAKGLGFVPDEMSDALGRGISFHLLAQAFHLKWNEDKLKEECEKERVRPHQLAAARVLWPTLEQYLETQTVISVEQEYKVPLPNSEHVLVGRFDACVDHGAGVIGLNEYKSAGIRKQFREIPLEWKANTQAESVILGARSLGYNPSFVDVITVKEGKPPERNVYRVERSEYQLEYYQRALVMTADIIQFLVDKYGVEEPWPHIIHSIWSSDMRGGCNNGWCEMQGICGQYHELGKVPTHFQQRDQDELWKRGELVA